MAPCSRRPRGHIIMHATRSFAAAVHSPLVSVCLTPSKKTVCLFPENESKQKTKLGVRTVAGTDRARRYWELGKKPVVVTHCFGECFCVLFGAGGAGETLFRRPMSAKNLKGGIPAGRACLPS